MEGGQELVLLHFNDAYDIQPDATGSKGFLNFYDHLRRKRQQYPAALLVFSGDAFAPSKLSRAMQGRQMAHCLGLLGIDVACYGNHDFDFEPEHALELARSVGCPWLLGNIKYVHDGSNIGEGLDYLVRQHCGVKIGFFGVAGPDFNGRLISAYAKKLRYVGIVEHSREVCRTLQSLGCELIIAITHARMPADSELARQVPQIDFILGGHDHSNLFQIVNQTPILKSGSDFEFLSELRVFRGGAGKDVRVGRRWNCIHECKKVKAAQQEHPEIAAYVAAALETYRLYDKERSQAHNRPKEKLPPLPQDEWLLEYTYVNNRPVLSLKAGLSAEVCFAKFVAFKRKHTFAGYKRAAPAVAPNFLRDTLKFIEAEVSGHGERGKTALYSPGICSVPYLVETANLVYLPSHFLVGVTRIDELIDMLNHALSQGYRCYAVLGYDPFIAGQLCAWIKFVEPPKEYLTLIEKLQIDDVLVMSCHDVKGENHGAERNARLVHGEGGARTAPAPGDIYAVFVQESYNKTAGKDIANFSSAVKDRTPSFWEEVAERPICRFIHDWESGIDCLPSVHSSLSQAARKPNVHFLLSADSWELYLVALQVGRGFIELNFREEQHPVRARGVVFNQYILSQPTYELNYGYLPLLYWQFHPNCEQRLLAALTEQEQQLTRWFNMHRGTRIALIRHDSFKITTDHLGLELAKWVTKHAPRQYSLAYLPLPALLQTLARQRLLYALQPDGFSQL